MRPFALLVHFLKDIRVHKPSMQFLPANPERILQILSGPRTKSIERHRKRRDFHLAHAASFFSVDKRLPTPFASAGATLHLIVSACGPFHSSAGDISLGSPLRRASQEE